MADRFKTKEEDMILLPPPRTRNEAFAMAIGSALGVLLRRSFTYIERHRNDAEFKKTVAELSASVRSVTARDQGRGVRPWDPINKGACWAPPKELPASKAWKSAMPEAAAGASVPSPSAGRPSSGLLVGVSIVLACLAFGAGVLVGLH